MIEKKKSKMRLGRVVFGFFFAMISVFGLLGNTLAPTETVYADPVETTETQAISTGDDCQATLGAIGWLVCPTTGAIAGAVDYLYSLIQDLLVINPVEMKDGQPIYEIWKYCRGFANIVFIIFLLVVIYSQLTGVGITNYGVKKALPKLIVVAILVNLSFLVCSLLVDASNIVGNSLRGIFTSVEDAAVAGMMTDGGMTATQVQVTNAEMFSSIAGGTALAIGGAVIAFETGAIWMLIPVVLGAIVAVVTGLITIALRQAVVALLIMIAPLAIVAYMLPNTENLFTKWRKLLTQMLVFYPAFSLLFGASSLAGFAIIASANSGFGLLLGVAVQIFPLFFSWKLMQMSGTFLGDINTKLRAIGARPVAGARTWADARRMASKQKHLASGRAVTPSLRLMQFASNRQIARDAETAKNAELVKNRGLAYWAGSKYDKDGVPTRRGEEAYENQARNMEYQRVIERDKNNMNKGLGQLVAVQSKNVSGATKARLAALDTRNILASDYLKAEQARGENIEYENAQGFYQRMDDAINVHEDIENGYESVLRDGQKVMIPKSNYKFHVDPSSAKAQEASVRYDTMREIMEGSAKDIHLVAADAAHGYDNQRKIIETKYQKYFEMIPPTKDLEYRLSELTKMSNAADYIDTILPGLRILNQRGDTDVVRKQMENVLNSAEGIKLGTHASQALASFLMFEVKGGDPFLRRYGKYINLETAHVYNKNERQNARLSLEEFITGDYDEWEQDESSGVLVKKKNPVKKPLVKLIEGTALDQVERTAYGNLDEMLMNAYTDENGLNVKKYLDKREEVEKAMGPAFVSASLKYESESEQLKSAVSFLTGYDGEKTRWGEGGDLAGDAEYAEKHFRDRTMKYLKGQTPAQILSMRSDYRNAVMEHLINDYMSPNEEEGITEEMAAQRRKEYNDALAEIQTRYGDESAEKATEKREKDVKALRTDIAGRQMRNLMDSTGKLEQIYRTRRSGAANNAKDWLREWLDLDNELKINKMLEQKQLERKRQYKENRAKKTSVDTSGVDGVVAGGFDGGDRAYFVAEVENLWDTWRDVDESSFYEESVKYIEKELQSVGAVILKKYEDYRKQFADTIAPYDLKEKLEELLQDPSNY